MTELNQQPHAVVLSGGGAFAAYEIGIMKALFTGASPATAPSPVDPEIVTGTSAGAFNAAFLVSHSETGILGALRNLEEVWLARLAGDAYGCHNGVARYRLNPVDLFNPACFLRQPALTMTQLTEDLLYLAGDFSQRLNHFFRMPGRLEDRLTIFVNLSSFVIETFNKVIAETIDFKKIGFSPRKFRIAVTNWTTGKVELCTNEQMSMATAAAHVEASAAIPGVFPPVRIGDSLYVDGGVLMNTPLNPALDAGAATMHVIYLDPDPADIPLPHLSGTLDVLGRLLAIDSAAAINHDIEHAAAINRGVEVLRAAAISGHIASDDLHSFLRFVGQSAGQSLGAGASLLQQSLAEGYQQVTIHRYHPHESPLGGVTGLLDFERPNIERLIQRGYDDAVHHNCTTEGCITPNGLSQWPSQAVSNEKRA
ncbi:MAG TPA: patatin-like phospholipase family protein [Candidatus Angelobacter sp.]|nr:patatin-like phospholipase family protein [Candidatus Angelobacter sp.]